MLGFWHNLGSCLYCRRYLDSDDICIVQEEIGCGKPLYDSPKITKKMGNRCLHPVAERIIMGNSLLDNRFHLDMIPFRDV